MMKFLCAMQNDILTLDVGKGVHNVEWSMDSAFGVRADFKSHAGATMTFKGGKGLTSDVSAKQKSNTESSTTAELVGVDCVSPLVLRVPLFPKRTGTQCAREHDKSRQQEHDIACQEWEDKFREENLRIKCPMFSHFGSD